VKRRERSHLLNPFTSPRHLHYNNKKWRESAQHAGSTGLLFGSFPGRFSILDPAAIIKNNTNLPSLGKKKKRGTTTRYLSVLVGRARRLGLSLGLDMAAVELYDCFWFLVPSTELPFSLLN